MAESADPLAMFLLPEQPTVFVLHRLPNVDGSGDAMVLGVFDSREKAEAAAGRRLMVDPYQQPLQVVEFEVNGGVEE